MKFKILAVIVVLIGAIVSFALKKEKVEVKVTSHPSVKLKKPIQAQEKVAVKIEPAPTIAEKPSSSLVELKGPIHNQYGIRDDILKYIEDTIPHWNKKAWMAAIAIAQEQQFLYYKAKTEQEAFSSSNRTMFAIKCLGREYPDNDIDYHIFESIENLMMNTKERKLHIWDVNSKFYSGKTYDRKIPTKQELLEKCESGAY